MEKIDFEDYKKKVARLKSIYALKSKIEDYKFKIIEYEMTIDNLKEELSKAQISLENLENLQD